MSNRKAKTKEERQLEIEGARLFGKQVSRRKGRILLAVTLITCALPMILGLRLWDQIPEVVPSGLVGSNGEDDSIPRWMVAFGLPGLMCLLNLIAHGQLLFNQKHNTLPSTAVRLVGRWGFPIISVLFCSGMIMQSTETGEALPLTFVTPCILGLVMLLLGSHMLDCPQDARIALRFSFCQAPGAWKAVHDFAGCLWLAVGAVVIAGVMITTTSTAASAVLILAALAAPVVFGRLRAKNTP